MLPNEPLAVSYIPDVGEAVYTVDGTPIRLESQLNAGGGEGIIYATSTNSVAKIYKKNKVTRRNCEKIKLMLTKKINCPGICAPEAALYNSDHEFVGYLMPQAKGETLQRGIFVKPRFLRLYPNWKKRDTIKLCITILHKIKYAQQGGSDQATNIINMDFSYPCGENSNKKTPEGPWRYIWSHLTRKLKDAFYNTFRKGGEHSTEGTRLGASGWRELFDSYLYAIESGRMGKIDKQSEELFPTALKKTVDANYVKCRLCGREVAENNCLEGICRNCLDTGETRHCAKCGREFIYKNYEKYIKHHGPKKLCDECNDWRQQPKYKMTCVDCGQVFTITNSEYEFYNGKGFDLPKRCKDCRDANRENGYSQPRRRRGKSGCVPTVLKFAFIAIWLLVVISILSK